MILKECFFCVSWAFLVLMGVSRVNSVGCGLCCSVFGREFSSFCVVCGSELVFFVLLVLVGVLRVSVLV